MFLIKLRQFLVSVEDLKDLLINGDPKGDRAFEFDNSLTQKLQHNNRDYHNILGTYVAKIVLNQTFFI